MKLGAIGGNLSKTPKKWLKNSKKRAKMPVFLVELKATKTHTVIYKINGREFYCAVDLPLSNYPLYGKQLVARG